MVPGYPKRRLTREERAAAILKTRTLTKLYNQRPAWLVQPHGGLDAAVALRLADRSVGRGGAGAPPHPQPREAGGEREKASEGKGQTGRPAPGALQAACRWRHGEADALRGNRSAPNRDRRRSAGGAARARKKGAGTTISIRNEKGQAVACPASCARRSRLVNGWTSVSHRLKQVSFPAAVRIAQLFTRPRAVLRSTFNSFP